MKNEEQPIKNVPNGSYELVVQYLGYELNIFKGKNRVPGQLQIKFNCLRYPFSITRTVNINMAIDL